MQLYVWGPALNAPSIDPKCIVIESYLRLVQQNYTIVKCNDPQQSPTGKLHVIREGGFDWSCLFLGELPLLNDGSAWVAGVDRILNYLSQRDKDANKDLSAEQKADYTA